MGNSKGKQMGKGCSLTRREFVTMAGTFAAYRTFGATVPPDVQPLVRFGIVTDLHYADIKPAGRGKTARHYRESLKVWDETIAKDIFAYVGEFGVWRATPHETALAFMEDVLSVWKERNLGWALWELRGSFGVMDSERTDVEYEDFNGHKLDRRMLELLQRY